MTHLFMVTNVKGRPTLALTIKKMSTNLFIETNRVY